MFRAVPMLWMQLIILAQDDRAVLKGLGQLGAVHLTRTQPGPDTELLTPIDNTSDITRYDHIRTRIQELHKAVDIPSPLSKDTTRKDRPHSERAKEMPVALLVEGATQAPLIEDALLSLEQRCAGMLEQRLRLLQRRKELTTTCERVSAYRGSDIPLDGLDQFSFLHFVTGSLPIQNYENFGKEVGDKVSLFPLVQKKGQQSIFGMTTRRGWPDLERALQEAGFQHEMLPVVEGATVDGLSEECQREEEQLATELAQLTDGIKGIAAEFSLPLKEIEEFVDMEYRLLGASQKFTRTDTTIVIAGWIPACHVATLEQRVGEITRGRYIIQTTLPETSAQEQVPVLLRHSRLLRPFEMLVSTYGLPNYREFEPTLFVALSYLVMFGMMFGDAGHGLVLALCGLTALFAGRTEKVRDIGLLLLFGGLSSIISGIVYGSYFGMEVFKKYALWHDPLEGDPMRLMYGAIGIGIVMISLGLILNVINRFRQGDVIGGILDKFGLIGILFYWGTLVLLINGEAIRSRGLMVISVIVFLVAPIVGWCLKRPIEHFMRYRSCECGETEETLASAIIESCVEAFEAILSYLANTISFVRLAAYAMSHAALIFAAFMLASVVRDFAVGGGLLSILVIIIGNFIAIVLEGIIASVQALRLEYYEFFGKFFSGSGQPFEPFHLKRMKSTNA